MTAPQSEPEMTIELRQFLSKASYEIQRHAERTVESVVSIGKELHAVREKLPHGQWLDWLEEEFEWNERTARNYIGAFEWVRANRKTFSDFSIDLSALHLLVRSSTPDPVKTVVAERLQRQEHVTHKDVKSLIAIHSQGPKRVPNKRRTPKQIEADRVAESTARDESNWEKFKIDRLSFLSDANEELSDAFNFGERKPEDYLDGSKGQPGWRNKFDRMKQRTVSASEFVDLLLDRAMCTKAYVNREEFISNLHRSIDGLVAIREELYRRGIIRRSEFGKAKPVLLKRREAS